MLNIPDQGSADESTLRRRFPVHMAVSAGLDFEALLGMARRRKRVILGGVAVGLLLVLVYLVAAVQKYTAISNLMMDTPKLRSVSDLLDPTSLDAGGGGVDTQVELIKSERIILGIIRKMNLKDHPAFNSKTTSFFAAIGNSVANLREAIGLGRAEVDPSEFQAAEALKERLIVEALAKAVEVKRVGRTYVLEIRYTDADPVLAAGIANAFAEQYLTEQLDAKYDATTRAAVWLQDRIGELRERSLAADTKVQKFRADNNLISVSGRLVNEQQLTDANTQLSDARAKMAEAEARAQRIEAIAKDGNVDAAVSESLANPVIASLRTKFLDASKREAEISKKLGVDHIAAVNLRSEMKQYERLLFDELARIGESYRSDYQIAKTKLESLEQNLKTMLAQTAGDNQVLVALRELERESDTYKTLYQTFLTRYQEAVQQQSFPITDARIITGATPPLVASWPKKGLLLALGLVVGLAGGAAAAYVLELRDQVFRTGEQVQSELGLEFLGLLPMLKVGAARPTEESSEPGRLGPISPLMRYSLTAPLSGFAETLRATKVAADIALKIKRPKIIGVVSVLPSEGKTTVTKNLASLVASLGSRSILIDCDMRNPGLTRNVAPFARDGLVEVLQGRKTLAEVALLEVESGLTIVPAVVHRKMTNSSELLSSQAMQSLLRKLGDTYDYIFLDLPPIGPVIDVRASTDLIDAFVFVIDWGKTLRSVVRSTLEVENEIHDKCLGVVLNKVDQVKMTLYEGSSYRNYYYSKYSKYYTS